jgi:signal transduction histidine kinase
LVKCINGEGIESIINTPLKIHIQKPYWQQWWFYIICFAALASILFSIYKYRLKQVLKLHKVRSHIANDLHDEVGSTLSGISITSQLLQKMNVGNNSINSDLLQSISTNSQQMLESMSDIIWSINPKNDKLEDILTRMRLFATEILEVKNIEVIFTMPEHVQKLYINIELRKDIYLIYKEAVNNIAKYANATKVTINLSSQNNQLNVQIADNGKGFEPNNFKTLGGNGLTNMRQRAKNLKGEIKFISFLDKGTQVILQVPLTTS